MQTPLDQILLNLWLKDKLAPFYIIKPSLKNHEFNLKKWAQALVVEILVNELNISQAKAKTKLKNGLSDVLFIEKEKGNKTYKVDNPGLRELIHLQNYENAQLKQRLIFVTDAQDITDTVANKLLKTLEEPKENTTIFFLYEGQQAILPTIESRAISMVLDNDSSRQLYKNSDKDFPTFLRSYLTDIENKFATQLTDSLQLKQYTEALEVITKNKALTPLVLDAIHEYNSSVYRSAASKIKYIEELKHFQESSTFNNYPSERILGLLLAVMC